MAQEPGNQTPNTPGVSESELREMSVDDLRQKAKDAEISGSSNMKKDELVKALAKAGGGSGNGRDRGDQTDDSDSDVGPGPDGGKVRTGPDSSKSLKYSQEITSPDDEPEREGRSLVTTSHEVIKEWAEARDAVPATVQGTDRGDHLGVLRFDFGAETANLEHVSWDDWFKTFDDRQLNFIYQEQRSDGRQSNFFRLENPGREDA
jgi:hypothetical protein